MLGDSRSLPLALHCCTAHQQLCCANEAPLEHPALSLLQAGELRVGEIVTCFRTWGALEEEWDRRAADDNPSLRLLHARLVSFVINNLVCNLCFMIQLFCSQQPMAIRAGQHQISAGRCSRVVRLRDAPSKGRFGSGNDGSPPKRHSCWRVLISEIPNCLELPLCKSPPTARPARNTGASSL